MRHLLVAILWLLSAASALANEPPQALDACASPEDCLIRLRELAKKPQGKYDQYTEEQTALTSRLALFGEVVVPELASMLSDPSESVASLAAKALREMKHIDPVFLPQVVAGLDRGLDWLPIALARIDSDEAALEAVSRYLASKSSPGNQEGGAVEILGARTLPFLVDAARCRPGCGPRNAELIADALAKMGHERVAAGPDLLAIASDKTSSNAIAVDALQMISALQGDGLPLESELIDLRTRRPDLARGVDEALIGIGSTLAGDIFADELRKTPDRYILRDLADTGAAGRSAGPVVVELLHHPDWDVRLSAARALGFIDYQPAVSALIKLLEDHEDVRLVRVVTESLGRLQASTALPALARTSRQFWFPPVRKSADVAIKHIKEMTRYEPAVSGGTFASAFFAYQYSDDEVPFCEKPDIKAKPESHEVKLRKKRDSLRLERLVHGASAASPVSRRDSGENVADDGDPADATAPVEQGIDLPDVPALALRVGNGWLTGTDNGEWGGELDFVGDDGSRQIVIKENIEDIYRLGNDYVAVTGLAHMLMNNGLIYRLEQASNDRWTATPWRALPGAPNSSWPVETGELLINVNRGGSILVDRTGAMRMMPCDAH
jgi:HEAT repeat protein